MTGCWRWPGNFQLLLTRYGLERRLYRLSQSRHRDRFVLKGAMLFILWSDDPHRPTRNVDFLGSGDSSEASLAGAFRDLCAIACEEDGVTYDSENVRVEPIRDDTEYGGMRVTLVGALAGARIPIQADIGFGDVVTPDTIETSYPALPGQPAPRLRAYPREDGTLDTARPLHARVQLSGGHGELQVQCRVEFVQTNDGRPSDAE